MVNALGAGGSGGGGGSPFSPGPLLSGVGGNNNDTVANPPGGGSLIYGNSTPLWDALIIGSPQTVLRVDSGFPAWGVAETPGGGTGLAAYTAGDMLYYVGGDTLNVLAIGNDGEILTVVSGAPSWEPPGAATTNDPNFQFLPAQNEPPTANPATFTTLTAATGNRPMLEFDGTTDETAIMSGVLRNYAAGGITVTFLGTMDSTNTGTKVVKLAAAFELVQSGDVLGAGGNDFASAQTAEIVVDNTAGTAFSGTIAFTDGAQIDGIVTGSPFRFKVTRNNSGLSGTNATGRYRLLYAIGENT